MYGVFCRRAVARPARIPVRTAVNVRSLPTVQMAQSHYMMSPPTLGIDIPAIAYRINDIYQSFVSSFEWLRTAVAQPVEEPQQAEEQTENALTASIMLARGTYKPHFKKRKRTVGFLKRLSTAAGRKVLARRVAKGRKRMAA